MSYAEEEWNRIKHYGGNELGDEMREKLEYIEQLTDACDELTRQRDDMLAALIIASKICSCNGTGMIRKSCSLCGDSTYEHECNDKKIKCFSESCSRVRVVIAGAQPK